MQRSDKESKLLDRRLTPDRLTGAVSGWLQTRLALTGGETRVVELALTAQAYDLLAQSGWLVKDEFSADILNKGTKYKRCDLVTYKTIDRSSPSRQPKSTSVSYVYEIKVLNNRNRATEGFQADLVADAARLALFGELFKNCEPTQLVIAGVGSLAAYLQDQKNRVVDSLERWAPLWGAMGSIAATETWRKLADARHYSKLKSGDELRACQTVLDQHVGLFSGEGRGSAEFPASVLCSGFEGTSLRDELGAFCDVLGSRSIKYDRGFVYHVQCPGAMDRIEGIGVDDYLVFAARVRAV